MARGYRIYYTCRHIESRNTVYSHTIYNIECSTINKFDIIGIQYITVQ